jgi:styrene monooxygenase reductase component
MSERREAASSFRRAASAYPTGVTVVTCFDEAGDGVHGMTANSFVTVSAEPPTVLVSVKQGGRMHALLSRQRRYGINVLGAGDEWLSRHFSGHPDAAARPRFRDGAPVPLLADAIAHFVCSVTQTVDVHDHTLFIANVLEWDASAHAALLFYRSRCHGIASQETAS